MFAPYSKFPSSNTLERVKASPPSLERRQNRSWRMNEKEWLNPTPTTLYPLGICSFYVHSNSQQSQYQRTHTVRTQSLVMTADQCHAKRNKHISRKTSERQLNKLITRKTMAEEPYNRENLNKSDSNWQCERIPKTHHLEKCTNSCVGNHTVNNKYFKSQNTNSCQRICSNSSCERLHPSSEKKETCLNRVKCNRDDFGHYHVEGMLDRDQRSVVNRLRDDVVDTGVVRHSCCCEWTVVTCVKFPSNRRQRNRQQWSYRVTQSKWQLFFHYFNC